MIDADALVLVAHGSRSADGRRAMDDLAARVASRLPGLPTHLGYLELCDPPATDVLSAVLADKARRVVVVPLMLHAAGHSKSDVPALVLDARNRNPQAEILYGRPFGADHSLLALARRRVEEAGGLSLSLAVLARGTSDPDANAEAYRVARLVADMAQAPSVAPGFSGVTWPDVRGALHSLRLSGARRVAAFAWFLATGVLIERMHEDFRRFSEETGIEVVDAGLLGTGPEVVDLVLDRAEEALEGRVAPNCDACAYRYPFPGLEDRVGMPVGVGHSHLAADHRHAHSLHQRHHRVMRAEDLGGDLS